MCARELPCGLPNLQRFYLTLGRYPGHRCVAADGLVVGALRAFPHFDGVAAGSLRKDPRLSSPERPGAD